MKGISEFLKEAIEFSSGKSNSYYRTTIAPGKPRTLGQEHIKNRVLNKLDIQVTESNCIYKSHNYLFEGFSIHNFPKGERGGLIVFSADVNINLDKVKDSDNAFKKNANKFVATINQKLSTMLNKLTYTKKVAKSIGSVMGTGDNGDGVGYTIGKYVKGVYRSKEGDIYNESSYCVDIKGISKDKLYKIANKLRELLKQESVLVTSYEDGESVLLEYDNETKVN